MKHKAVLEWNNMGLIQQFVDDAPPPDEGRNFYKILLYDALKAQFNTWGGCDDHATIWTDYLAGAMSIGALPFPPKLLFLFTIPVEISSGPAFCSAREAVSLYKRTPFLLTGEQPEHRDAVLFNNWDAFLEVCKQSALFHPLWNWAIDYLDQDKWWVVTIDPSFILPENIRNGKLWQK